MLQMSDLPNPISAGVAQRHGPAAPMALHTSGLRMQSQWYRQPPIRISSQTISGRSALGTGSDVVGQMGHVMFVVGKQYSLFVGHGLQ